MVAELFESLGKALTGAALPAVLAAAAWGVMSILLSPCHLASIPLIVAFIGHRKGASAWQAFWTSTAFATGILVTIGVVGGVTALAGRMIGDVGSFGNYFVAAIFLLVGLVLLGVIDIPWSGFDQSKFAKRGVWAALVLGLVFGIAIGPCTFAYLAPMLAVGFKAGASSPVFGVTLLAAYGVGHCSVIVLAGSCTNAVQRYLNWNDRSGVGAMARKLCGMAMIAAGLYLIYVA